jgi:Pyridoxamine 5'-phosphate oxidase
MPGYGIYEAEKGKGLLPWTWAEERLITSHNYWFSTARPDGRPHTMPVWGVWSGNYFYFSTGRDSRKARNLAANPFCVITTESGAEAVIVEGQANEIPFARLPAAIADAYQEKYNSALDPQLGPIFVITPQTAFAFIEGGDEPDDFVSTATRWRFNEITHG